MSNSFGRDRRVGAFRPVKAAALDLADAEAVGAEALAGLADDEALLMQFLSETGIGPADLLAGAGQPNTLAAILDYVVQNEPLLLTLAARRQIKPELFALALAKLQKPTDDGF